eukprot:4307170-Prymnesium_polylepis.3
MAIAGATSSGKILGGIARSATSMFASRARRRCVPVGKSTALVWPPLPPARQRPVCPPHCHAVSSTAGGAPPANGRRGQSGKRLGKAVGVSSAAMCGSYMTPRTSSATDAKTARWGSVGANFGRGLSPPPSPLRRRPARFRPQPRPALRRHQLPWHRFPS